MRINIITSRQIADAVEASSWYSYRIIARASTALDAGLQIGVKKFVKQVLTRLASY
jgi:hypothetical protein